MKIYYHNDLDGRCAAAIACRWNMDGPISFKDIDLIEVDYKDTIHVDTILANETVVIVDISFKPEVMEKVLERTSEIIWIDHHKTAFEYKYSRSLEGLRLVDYSGCELAWLWFRLDKPMPRAVELIGDYDKWALKFQPECFQFYEGLKMEDTTPKSEIWDRLFENKYEGFYPISLGGGVPGRLHMIVEQGKSAIKYRDNYCSKICHDFGYEIELDGHKAFATNFFQFGSKGFGDRMDQYDFCVAYIHDGKKFTVSLYSVKGVDVSEIAKKFGGGGHAGAAGFVTEKLPWRINS